MPTADQITDTTPTVNLIADLIEQEAGHWAEPPAGERARTLARDVLAALVGSDEEPGPLDRYEIRAEVVPGAGKPIVIWYCPRVDHADGNPDGVVGIIVRDLDGDQAGLTLGEILGAVLRHEHEQHGRPAV